MNFSQKVRLYVFYTEVRKSQEWPKTQIKWRGGGAAALTYTLKKTDNWTGILKGPFPLTIMSICVFFFVVVVAWMCMYVGCFMSFFTN